jgi:hypothetical protein
MARAMFPLITVLCQQNTFRCFTHIMHDIHHVLRLERRPDKLDLLGVHAELGVGQAAQLVDEYPREEIIVRREVFCRVGERVLVGLWRSAHRAAGRERSSATSTTRKMRTDDKAPCRIRSDLSPCREG